MFCQVNGVQLYFDVEGAGLVADGATLRKSRRSSCCTADPASTTRCSSRISPASLRHRPGSFMTTTVAMAAAKATIRRTGTSPAPKPERRAKFLEVCFPLYRARPKVNPTVARSILKRALASHFNGPQNEHGRLDFRSQLAKVPIELPRPSPRRCRRTLCASKDSKAAAMCHGWMNRSVRLKCCATLL
jgi:hypothetical protein